MCQAREAWSLVKGRKARGPEGRKRWKAVRVRGVGGEG